jgi:FkbM family methyltransferase
MTVVVGLLVGNETWKLQERSIRSLRSAHPDQAVIIYYSLNTEESEAVSVLLELGVETVDIGTPGLMGLFSASTYSNYNTTEFNIKTSFKWLALQAAMVSKMDNVIFLDADIKIISPLPFNVFAEIWEYYDIFVQDEGNSIFPKHPCTGFIGLKFCEANISLLEALHKEQCAAIVSAESQHDQTTFHRFISRSIDLYKKIYFLPQALFPVGYLGPLYEGFGNSTLTLKGPSDPVIYHANWAVGIEAKAVLMDSFKSCETPQCINDDENIKYNVGRFEIKLPLGHLLPFYQSSHPRYDRFLPLLVKFLPESSAVVDVGANCGDSLASMASCNSSLHYICIEADKAFFSLLEENIALMRQSLPSLKVDALSKLIGKELDRAVLRGSGGTKQAVAAQAGAGLLKTTSLDTILLKILPDKEPISLLKTDTDGWDYDIISSASQAIKRHFPLIFFECQYSNEQQLGRFAKTVSWLFKLGYNSWFVFDNYGEFILETSCNNVVKELMDYVDRQNSGLTTRTFYYMDILVSRAETREIALSAVKAYVS